MALLYLMISGTGKSSWSGYFFPLSECDEVHGGSDGPELSEIHKPAGSLYVGKIHFLYLHQTRIGRQELTSRTVEIELKERENQILIHIPARKKPDRPFIPLSHRGISHDPCPQYTGNNSCGHVRGRYWHNSTCKGACRWNTALYPWIRYTGR